MRHLSKNRSRQQRSNPGLLDDEWRRELDHEPEIAGEVDGHRWRRPAVARWRDGVLIDEAEVDADSFEHRFRDAPGEADRRYRIEMINDSGKAGRGELALLRSR